jgi:hypothetical protein
MAVFVLGKRGPKDFVAADDFLQTLLEQCRI